MRTVRPQAAVQVVLAALLATLALAPPAAAIGANTPVVPVPEARWGDLEPRAILGDTTYFTFAASDGEPDCRTPFWFDVTAANGYVITAAGNSIDVWNANGDASEPSLLQTMCRPVLGTFKKSDTDFFFFKVATLPNDSSFIAVASGSKMGVLVIDNRSPGNARTIYQDEGSSTVGSDYNAEDVVMLKSGSRRLLYVLAGNQVIAYDVDRIAGMATPCLQENGCVSGVHLGQLSTSASKIAGAGKYLITMWGTEISVWDTSSNPSNPTLAGTLDPTGTVLLDLAAWQVGGVNQVAATGFSTTEVWTSLNCLPSCGNGTVLQTPSSNFVTGSVDRASGRAYVFVGSELTRQPKPQVEYVFDVATFEELTPEHPDGYWGWYYPGNDTGFNNTRPLAAVVQDGHVYRAAYSFFDVHEIVGAGRPPIASFGWSPDEPYAGDPVAFNDGSTGSPNAWAWTFVGADIDTSASRNPNNVAFLAPTSQGNPTTATLVAINDLGSSDPVTRSITVRDPAPAISGITASVSSAPVCSVIEFTAAATGKPPLVYDWDVVDSLDQPLGTAGANGNVFNWDVPQALTPGQYRASLIVSGVGSTPEVLSSPVTIEALDDLALTSGPSATTPDFGLVHFSITDTGATAWTWDFGDGNCPSGFTPVAAGCRTTNPALGRNPSHQYIVGETTYDVTVTIENCRDGSITSDVLQVVVDAVQQLIPKFTAQGCQPFIGCIANVGTPVVFNDETTGFPEKYEVDWNGNGTFVEETPSNGQFTHTYTQANSNPGYRPVLRVTRGSQVKTYEHPVILVEPADPSQQPSVSVSSSNSSPLVNATVVFTARANNCTSPSSWTWSLGSGATVTSPSSTGSSISVRYSSTGTRTVRATANGGGCDGLSGTRSVSVRDNNPPPPPPPPQGNNPTARFTYSPGSPSAGQAVSFDASSSSNAAAYQWDFGDGTKATGVKVNHVYDSAGQYVVKLEASRPDTGCDFNVCIGSTQSTVNVKDDTPPPPPPPANGCEGELADDPGTLCLLNGRFQVQVDWTNQHNNDDEGIGQGELYSGSQRTGLFWFFNPDNIELIVKMIDASAVDGKIWFFYGALSDVEYTIRVLDTATGQQKTYSNQAGAICGLGDTGAFQAAIPPSSSAASLPPTSALGAATTSNLSAIWNANHGILPHDDEPPKDEEPPEEEAPTTNEGALSLLGGRFQVTVDFTNQYDDDAEGVGKPIAGTNKSGYFWFFRPDNLELVVKMIDARSLDGNFWVFWGGLSDVKYNIQILDTQSEQEWTYSNPAGSICGGADLQAFTDLPL